MMSMLRSLLAGLLLSLCATAAHALPSISVAPGSSPGGYLPLDAFGVAPVAIGDEQSLNLVVPNYVYAGESWNRVGITSNGYIMVGGTSGSSDVSFINTALPVIEWRLNTFGTSTLNVFQSWIGLNGVEDITFVYSDQLDSSAFVLDNLTIGANDKTGTVGGTYYFNGAGTFPADFSDLRVTTTDLPVEVPEPTTLALLGAGLVAFAGLRRRPR
jgi:hypothetical protein